MDLQKTASEQRVLSSSRESVKLVADRAIIDAYPRQYMTGTDTRLGLLQASLAKRARRANERRRNVYDCSFRRTTIRCSVDIDLKIVRRSSTHGINWMVLLIRSAGLKSL